MSGSGRTGEPGPLIFLAKTRAACIDVRHKILKKWAPGGKRAMIVTPQFFADLTPFHGENWPSLVFDLGSGEWTISSRDGRQHGVGLAELGHVIFELPVATVARLLSEIIANGDRSRA
jgi:hypothetical protein